VINRSCGTLPDARLIQGMTLHPHLAHGSADDIVPESQSRLFYQALVEYHNDTIRVQYDAIEGAGHGSNFIEGQLDEVFQFIHLQ